MERRCVKGKGHTLDLIDVLFVDGRFMERRIIAFSEIEDDLFDFGEWILHSTYGFKGQTGLAVCCYIVRRRVKGEITFILEFPYRDHHSWIAVFHP